MFIRKKVRHNQDGTQTTYLQLVENRSVNGKSRQRVLCSLGRLDDPKLIKGLESIAATASRHAELETLRLDEATRTVTQSWGPTLIWGRLWRETVGPLVEEGLANDRLARAAYLMVLHRLVDPGSKCAAFRFAQDVHEGGFEELQLHDLYRALDGLAGAKEGIERRWFEGHRDLFTETDLVYFDTTSSYLEGSHPEGLAEFGYSRDKRGDRRQIGVGVLLTREGLPIAHLVLPGSTADPVAFREAIHYLQEHLGVGRVMLCCDRGMVSARTLEDLREAGLTYLVAVRMRRERRISAEVLARAGRYRVIEENLQVKEVALEGAMERYLVCYNPLRAEEDRRTREAIVAELEARVASGTVRGLLSGPARRYLMTPEGEPRLDRAKIETDARMDGKWVLKTNSDLSASEAAQAYKGLWRVEQAFRTLKTPLELRPIYHWTEQRIRGHVMVCFLAFLLRQQLTQRLQQSGWEGSFTELTESLATVRDSIVRDRGGQCYRLRDEVPAAAMPAFKALGMRLPRHVERLD